jgi:CBS domain-containing protein
MMAKPARPLETQKLPIRRRCLIGEGDPEIALEVFCPSQEATVPAERCAECGFLTSFPRHPARPDATLECAPPGLDGSRAARKSHKIDFAEAAARMPLGEFVNRQVVCVRPTTSVDHLRALMADADRTSFPVVDARGKLLGIISKADLVREPVADDDEVSSLMSQKPFSLPEDARLAHAISLMAAEKIESVPVLTAEGTVVGMVSAGDCLRWVAAWMGY